VLPPDPPPPPPFLLSPESACVQKERKLLPPALDGTIAPQLHALRRLYEETLRAALWGACQGLPRAFAILAGLQRFSLMVCKVRGAGPILRAG